MLRSDADAVAIADRGAPATTLRAKLFRGLADPARLALVAALLERPHTVGELVECTGLAQPNASKHLACLRDCGLVAVTREGRTATYRLAPDVSQLLRAADAVLLGPGPGIAACPTFDQPS